MGDAEKLGHRQLEDAEAVDLADAQMDRQGGGRHQPSIKTGPRDGMLTIEYGEHGVFSG